MALVGYSLQVRGPELSSSETVAALMGVWITRPVHAGSIKDLPYLPLYGQVGHISVAVE